MSYNVKGNFGCTEHFFFFLSFLVVNSLRRQEASRLFVPSLASNVTFHVFQSEKDTRLCSITAPVHLLFIHLCSLPISVSVRVPVETLAVSSHSLNKVKAIYRSCAWMQGLTDACENRARMGVFIQTSSRFFPHLFHHKVCSLMKNPKEKRTPCRTNSFEVASQRTRWRKKEGGLKLES